MTETTCTVTSTTGVRFTAKILRQGDRYGLDDVLVWEDERPGVEFYDTRYPHTPLGQFVSRYFVETLLEGPETGLDLMGYEPSWKIDAAAMKIVRQWLRTETTVKRSYSIGIPMAVTVYDDGRVEFDFDLCEVSDIDEDDEAFARYGSQVALDALTVSEAASKIGNHHNLTTKA